MKNHIAPLLAYFPCVPVKNQSTDIIKKGPAGGMMVKEPGNAPKVHGDLRQQCEGKALAYENPVGLGRFKQKGFHLLHVLL